MRKNIERSLDRLRRDGARVSKATVYNTLHQFTDAGLLRRQFAQAGETLPVKSLLGIMADESVSDAEIEQFIANWVPPSADELDD